jgi:hypothetical protein
VEVLLLPALAAWGYGYRPLVGHHFRRTFCFFAELVGVFSP